jgi:putative methanogenesis marker protein 8
VGENITNRIRKFGMCTPARNVLMSGEYVGFGASELISYGLSITIFDAAVIACDGAGTVIAMRPDLVQGIGGRMSGLVSTSPYPPVIAAIEQNGGIVPFRHDARIDQVKGTRIAYDAGYSKVAITIALADDAAKIRSEFPEAFIIAVHTTGITDEEARLFAENADIVTACASRAVREVAGKRALLQAGSSVPVFAMTQKAKELILWKVIGTKGQFLVTGAELPFGSDTLPKPLV